MYEIRLSTLNERIVLTAKHFQKKLVNGPRIKIILKKVLKTGYQQCGRVSQTKQNELSACTVIVQLHKQEIFFQFHTSTITWQLCQH